MPSRLSWGRRTQARLIAAIGYPLLRAMGATYRYEVEGLEHLAAVEAAGRQPIYAFWHGRILPATVYFRNRGIVVITSEHFDGEWIAGIIARFGYGAARGSTTRGAVKALRQLVREVRGRPAGFTVDGPRGPAGVAQPGALWLAKTTGNPVVPFHAEAARHWELPSWDRTQIPRPLSRVALVVGAPIAVARDADSTAIDDARRRLEDALRACERRCHALLARERASDARRV